MRLSKNKRTKTLLQRKGKKQSKLIKLHNLGAQPTPALDLGAHVACLRHQRPPGLCRNVAGVRGESVCVCVRAWSVTVSSCKRTEHLLDAVRLGQRGGGGVGWGSGQEVIIDGRSDSL